MHPELSNNEICKFRMLQLLFTLANHVIAKRLGRQWQAEKDEVRNLYRAKAAEIKTVFMAKHPDYKYQPRKPCEVKRRAKKSTESRIVEQVQNN